MILCIGPISVGKTLILRRLQQKETYADPVNGSFDTIPTVGTNIATLKFAKKTVKVQEFGGAMAPIWKNHFNDCSGIVFVIDSCNMFQISCACIQMFEVLNHKLLKNSKFLIVLNKTDLKASVNIIEIKYLLRLDDIFKHATQEIKVIESSCLTGRGIKEIKEWLSQFAS